MMRHGDYMLADHDLPFSGPFGLTSFIIDFILSPADLQVVDDGGLRCGNFGGQLLAEIPGSHPCYLMKGMYLLPAATALTRTITGTAAGDYSYNTVTPDGASILLENVATKPGHQDVIAINADATQIRFTPAVEKTFSLTAARMVDGQARALSIAGVGGGPGNDLDLTLSPELNLVRIGNRGATRNLTLQAVSVTKGGAAVNRNLPAIAVPGCQRPRGDRHRLGDARPAGSCRAVPVIPGVRIRRPRRSRTTSSSGHRIGDIERTSPYAHPNHPATCGRRTPSHEIETPPDPEHPPCIERNGDRVRFPAAWPADVRAADYRRGWMSASRIGYPRG